MRRAADESSRFRLFGNRGKENATGTSNTTGLENTHDRGTSASLASRSRYQEAAVGSSSSVGNVTATPHLSKIRKKNLRPGDILLQIDEDRMESLIRYGQVIPKLKNKKLDNKVVHAVIWVQSPGSTEKRKEVAQAIPTGVESGSLKQGKYKVFRPLDKNLGFWAAQVASTWSKERSDEEEKIPYSYTNAALSIVRRSSYGSKAKKELNKYATDAFTNLPAWKNKGIFCSQFVIAAYQGAFQNIIEAQAAEEGEKPHKLAPPQGMLASRAKTTTPATLEYFLQNDKNFMSLGILEADAPYYFEPATSHPVSIMNRAPIHQSRTEPEATLNESFAPPANPHGAVGVSENRALIQPSPKDISLEDPSITEPEFEKMVDSSLEDPSITEPEFERMI